MENLVKYDYVLNEETQEEEFKAIVLAPTPVAADENEKKAEFRALEDRKDNILQAKQDLDTHYETEDERLTKQLVEVVKDLDKFPESWTTVEVEDDSEEYVEE